MKYLIKALFVFSLMSGSFMTDASERRQFHCIEDLIIHYQRYADIEGKSLPEFIDDQVKILSTDLQLNQLNIDCYKQIKEAYLQTNKRSPADLEADELKTHFLLWQLGEIDQHSPLFGVYDDNDSLKLDCNASDSEVQRLRQIYKDHLLALSIQEEDAGHDRGGYKLFPLAQKLTSEDIASYDKIVTAASLIKHDSDVHTMTTTFARPYYAETKRLEEKYLKKVQHHKALTLEEIETDIKEFALRNSAIAQLMPSINPVLLLIKSYWVNPIDNETQLDIREVMSNCFLLARVYGDNALGILCHVLADNIMTNGGCHPGVTGRLAHTYFIDVSASISTALW